MIWLSLNLDGCIRCTNNSFSHPLQTFWIFSHAFGFTIAPATFQALMNEVFQPYLCKFVFVFFDSILIFSSSWEDHPSRFQLVFNLLHAHHHFLKRSKCSFGASKVTYLGHIIIGDGVYVNDSKVAAVTDCPIATTAKALRRFLRSAGY